MRLLESSSASLMPKYWVGQRRLGDGDGRRFVFFQHLALEDDFFQRAFEIAHVRFDVFGDEVGDVIRQREVLLFRLAF